MEKSVLKLDKNHKLKKLLKKEILNCKTRTNKEHNGIENDSHINYVINIKTKLCECTRRKKKIKKHKKNKKKQVELTQIFEKEKHNKVKKEELPQYSPKINNSEDRILPGCRRSTCIASIERKHKFKKNNYGNSARLCQSKDSKTQKEKRREQKRKKISAVDNPQDYYEDISSDESFSGSESDHMDKLICRTKEREKNVQLSKTNSSTDKECMTKETCMKRDHVTKVNSINLPVIKKEYSEEDYYKTTCLEKLVKKRELMKQEAYIKTEDIAEKHCIKNEYFEEEDIKSTLSDLILIEDGKENKTIESSSSDYYSPEGSLIDNYSDNSCMDFSDANSIHSLDTLIVSNKHVTPVPYSPSSPTESYEDLDFDFKLK